MNVGDVERPVDPLTPSPSPNVIETLMIRHAFISSTVMSDAFLQIDLRTPITTPPVA